MGGPYEGLYPIAHRPQILTDGVVFAYPISTFSGSERSAAPALAVAFRLRIATYRRHAASAVSCRGLLIDILAAEHAVRGGETLNHALDKVQLYG